MYTPVAVLAAVMKRAARRLRKRMLLLRTLLLGLVASVGPAWQTSKTIKIYFLVMFIPWVTLLVMLVERKLLGCHKRPLAHPLG